jgi:Tfp pilus assembly protein PilO
MDKKSKILFILFVVLLVLSVSYTFYKTVILQDFEVINTEEEGTGEEDQTVEENQSDDSSLETENSDVEN